MPPEAPDLIRAEFPSDRCCPALPLRGSCRVAFLEKDEVVWSSHFLEDRLNV